MKITCSNTYDSVASSFSAVTDAGDAAELGNILISDFSTAYSSAGNNIQLLIRRQYLGGSIYCQYVAIAGHNFGTIGGTLDVKVTGYAVPVVVTKTTVFAAGSPDNVVFFHFDEAYPCTQIEIVFTKLFAQDQVTISYVAAGGLLPLGAQNNEPGGYMRPWMIDSRKTRSVINDAGSPVAYLRETVSQKMSLKIDNVANSVFDSQQWLDFIGLAYDAGAFFIKERDGAGLADNPKSSYLCFNADVKVTAHSTTRALNNLSVQFQAYTGH